MFFTRLIKTALFGLLVCPLFLNHQTVSQIHFGSYGWKGDGSTGYIQARAALAAPSSYAYIFAVKADHVPGATTSESTAVSLRRWVLFDWDHSSTAFQQACSQYDHPASTWANAKATTSLQANKWHWIGCRWDGSTLAIFMDGELQASSATTGIAAGSDAALVDRNFNADGTLGSSYANTSVAGLAVWQNSIPSDSDLEYLTNPDTACSILRGDFAPEGLVLDWGMRTASPVVDQSGYSNPGTVNGGMRIVLGPCLASGLPHATKPAGLLTASSNGRYFQANGKTIVLAGSHTWYDAGQKRSDKGYAAAHWTPDLYAIWLQQHGMNFTRLWLQAVQPSPAIWNSSVTFTNLPYNRSSTCCAADGGNKFDLTSYNDAGFFDPLYREIQILNQDGIYVSVQVTSGAGGMVNKSGSGGVNAWQNNPYRCDASACNNIQGANGDPRNLNNGVSMQSTTAAGNTYPGDTSALGYEDDLIKHFIDKLGSLKGIIWEIGNEPSSPDPDCNNWAQHIITLIRTYEVEKQYQHPIWYTTGITATGWNGGCETGNTGTPLADAWGPGHGTPTDNFPDPNNPAISATNQVQIADSDHIGANTTTQDQLWRWFMRGWNIALMDDPWNGTNASTHTAAETNTTSGERYSLGYMLNFANQMPMQNVVPWDNKTAGIGKCGTTWCLTDDSTVYLMYYPTGSSMGAENLTVNSSASTSTCEWFDPDTGTTSACTYQGTGSHSYTAPGTDPYLLFVH